MLILSKEVVTIEQEVRTAKDKAFISKWTVIRQKGKLRYVATRGAGYGLLLFGVWLLVTWAEIGLSEFQQALYAEHRYDFLRRCVIWFVCYVWIGFIIAMGSWRRKEEKLNYLS